MDGYEDFSIIQKLTFELISLLSKRNYEQFFELVDSSNGKKEPSLSDFEYLKTIFSDMDIDDPYKIPYSDDLLCYYERLDQKGYALDCQLLTNQVPNNYILNLQFMKHPNKKTFTILFDGIYCPTCS